MEFCMLFILNLSYDRKLKDILCMVGRLIKMCFGYGLAISGLISMFITIVGYSSIFSVLESVYLFWLQLLSLRVINELNHIQKSTKKVK